MHSCFTVLARIFISINVTLLVESIGYSIAVGIAILLRFGITALLFRGRSIGINHLPVSFLTALVSSIGKNYPYITLQSSA